MAKITIQNKNTKNAVSSKNNTALTTNKLSLGKDNKAVSAVIGVILMVAITVILAAIIGVFVMNMSGNLPKMPGYAAFEVERVAATGPDTLVVRNVASNGEPITVIELSGKIANGSKPIIIEAPAVGGYDDLTKVSGEVTVTLPAGLADAFELTIVGQTADGGKNILQTFDVVADAEA